MKRILCFLAVLALTYVSAAKAQDYLLQPGDVIDVSVLEDPGLNREILVRPDGKINLPLAGTVQAAGRTPEAVQADLRRALSRDFVAPPTVTVSLRSVASGEDVAAGDVMATVYVIGEVGRPGPYEFTQPTTILQALAIAGGPGVFAARDRIQIRRFSGSSETVFLFDYQGIEDGRAPSMVLTLRDGDVIVVPERGLFD